VQKRVTDAARSMFPGRSSLPRVTATQVQGAAAPHISPSPLLLLTPVGCCHKQVSPACRCAMCSWAPTRSCCPREGKGGACQ
jgi:hypothetical protein